MEKVDVSFSRHLLTLSQFSEFSLGSISLLI